MITQTEDKTLYNKDFYLWIQETTNLLKTRQLDQLDYENLIDEVESLGFMEKANLRDNLRTLLRSLLKWKYLPPQDNNDWSSTALQACFELRDSLEVSPSLNSYFDEVLEETYQIARKLASIETESDIFPVMIPFKKEEILNDDYYFSEEN
jgi:hypothetical protein